MLIVAWDARPARSAARNFLAGLKVGLVLAGLQAAAADVRPLLPALAARHPSRRGDRFVNDRSPHHLHTIQRTAVLSYFD